MCGIQSSWHAPRLLSFSGHSHFNVITLSFCSMTTISSPTACPSITLCFLFLFYSSTFNDLQLQNIVEVLSFMGRTLCIGYVLPLFEHCPSRILGWIHVFKPRVRKRHRLATRRAFIIRVLTSYSACCPAELYDQESWSQISSTGKAVWISVGPDLQCPCESRVCV